MANDIKKVGELQQVTELMEGDVLLAARDGEFKRVDALDVAMPKAGTPHQQLVTGADGTAKWEDRYGYKEEAYAELCSGSIDATGEVDEYTYTYDGQEYVRYEIFPSRGPDVFDPLNQNTPAVGTMCRVTVDGVPYECSVCISEDTGEPMLGNPRLMLGSTDNGMPIAFHLGSGDRLAYVGAKAVYSVTIEVLEEEIVPIPAEYLRGYDAVIMVDESYRGIGLPNDESLYTLTGMTGKGISDAIAAGGMPRIVVIQPFYYGDDSVAIYPVTSIVAEQARGENYGYVTVSVLDAEDGYAIVKMSFNSDGSTQFVRLASIATS